MGEIYVFDMDGVLIDSMEHFKEGNLRILDEENITYAVQDRQSKEVLEQL